MVAAHSPNLHFQLNAEILKISVFSDHVLHIPKSRRSLGECHGPLLQQDFNSGPVVSFRTEYMFRSTGVPWSFAFTNVYQGTSFALNPVTRFICGRLWGILSMWASVLTGLNAFSTFSFPKTRRTLSDTPLEYGIKEKIFGLIPRLPHFRMYVAGFLDEILWGSR